MNWIVLLIISSVFTSSICQTLDVICESYGEVGNCSVTNLNSIDGELNFLTSNNSFRESITQIIFNQSSLNKVPSGIFSAYRNLKALSMNDCKIKQIEANTFEAASNLKDLELSNNTISHFDDSTFNGAENLEKLWLDSNNIEKLPTEVFTKLINLKHLLLHHNNITDLNESIFSSLRHLTHLSLKNNTLGLISHNLFSKNTEIEWLSLGGNQLTDDVEYAITNLMELKTLDLEQNKLTKFSKYPESVTQLYIGMNQLRKLFINKNVKSLNADQNQITQIDGADFSKLKELSLSNNKLKLLNNSTFDGAENLEHLWLNSNEIEELPSGIFTKLTKLKVIFIESNKIQILEDSIFSSLRHLSDVSLKGNKLKIISQNLFSQNTEIKWLSFRENQLTDDVAYTIQHLNQLEMLDLSDNKLTQLDNYPESVTHLYIDQNQLSKLIINKNVELVTAYQNKITQIDGIDSTFSSLRNLINLSLKGNKLTVINPNLFSQNTEMKILNLRENQLTEVEYAIQNLKNLEEIDLGINQITKFDNYPESVIKLFIQNNQLTKLFINKNVEALYADQNLINQIDGTDFSMLKELSLSNNKLKLLKNSTFDGAENLEHLWLNSNDIEELPSGIFTKITKLKVLILENNKIHILDDSTFSSLRYLSVLSLKGNELKVISPNLFSHNSEIKWLSLRENQLTNDVELAIQKLYKLQSLDLGINRLTELNNYPESVTQLDIRNNQLTKLFINKNVEILYALNNKITVFSADPDNKIKTLILRGNNLWSAESIYNLQMIESLNIESDLMIQILDSLLINEVFNYFCVFSKTLLPSCRNLAVNINFKITNENMNSVIKSCAKEFLSVIN